MTANRTAVESNANNVTAAMNEANRRAALAAKRKKEDITAWLKDQEDAELDLIRYEMSHRGRTYESGSDCFDANH